MSIGSKNITSPMLLDRISHAVSLVGLTEVRFFQKWLLKAGRSASILMQVIPILFPGGATITRSPFVQF